ncbi:MAG: YigZ family protein [Flavobacteriales bacterium]|nr:YigZ family protein [Flavobacteriales bacterium]MDG1779521.1 YigZ family protein [Flavobacteriales bacterium]MDG2246271.1 YigZ family protein [Flavobacteriales bacterium]
MDTYRTLKGRSESLYKVKGSKHFGYAFPVYSEEEIKECLEIVKKEHHSARHHCYAWRLDLDKKRYRANDDGEPSNSAGKPILGQIQSFDLTNVFIVVVRYFGGTKLGVGGLIDAYRTAARMAIEDGTIIEKQVKQRMSVKFPYGSMGSVMKVLKDFDLEMLTNEFEIACVLTTEVRLDLVEQVSTSFEDIDHVTLTLLD